MLNEYGEEVFPDCAYARKHADGRRMVPPQEIWPMLDLLKPALSWAPLSQDWQISKAGNKTMFKITIKPDAPANEWRAALGFLADWEMQRGAKTGS